jgi:DNA-binding response OmpR family regulator
MLDAKIQHGPAPVLNGNETVLVVDDIESVRSFLNDALPMFGYNVICAEDGVDGLKKFRENKDKIHVMLLDIIMPRLNGVELFEEINKLESNAKALFMSGSNDILDKTNLQGKIKCISKPFRIKTLLKEIREVLDH